MRRSRRPPWVGGGEFGGSHRGGEPSDSNEHRGFLGFSGLRGSGSAFGYRIMAEPTTRPTATEPSKRQPGAPCRPVGVQRFFGVGRARRKESTRRGPSSKQTTVGANAKQQHTSHWGTAISTRGLGGFRGTGDQGRINGCNCTNRSSTAARTTGHEHRSALPTTRIRRSPGGRRAEKSPTA